MLPHVTCAALVAENRSRAHPCSVDSIPTAANQEDHVSMATHGARRLREMAENTAMIVAIELSCGAQAVDLQTPSDPSPGTRPIYDLVRGQAAFMDQDRLQSAEFEAIRALVREGAFTPLVPLEVFSGEA
jgi:histidine ammonia-lyase